jgi:S1-C subfamily serine protease/tetratricopeptide (TPR) repeat protein
MATERAAEALAESPQMRLLVELRKLHRDAGAPTFRSMARSLSSVSHTTVSEIFSGKRLPSWKILADVVRLLGGDEDAIRALWSEASFGGGGAGAAPAYLGRVLRGEGSLVGTCIHLGRGVYLTAEHVVRDSDRLLIEPLRGGSPHTARLVRAEPQHDLAILECDIHFESAVTTFLDPEDLRPADLVVITGVSTFADRGRVEVNSAIGRWAGRITRDGVEYGAVETSGVVPGMSGAPVMTPDGKILGIVSGRYNSIDGWLRDSVYITLSDRIVPLLRGTAAADLVEFEHPTVSGTRGQRPGDGVEPRVRMVGRMPLLADSYQERNEQIHRLTQDGRSGAHIVITGMGGIGKTQLAARFATQMWSSESVDFLAWIDGSSRTSMLSAYARAAAEVLGDDLRPSDDAPTRFLEWLANTDQRWLVVIDDLASPSDLGGLRPPHSPNGTVLVTTRRRDAALRAEQRTFLDIGLFAPEEAHQYLQHRLRADQLSGSELLAADLGYLPLALAQASAYIIDKDLSCDQYRSRLHNLRVSMRSLVPESESLPDGQRFDLTATWKLSIEAADDLAPRGLSSRVLNLAAFLDPQSIPAALFGTASLLEFLNRSADQTNPFAATDARDAIANLRRLSLVWTRQLKDHFDVHPLVQRACREALQSDVSEAIVSVLAMGLMELAHQLPAETRSVLPFHALALRRSRPDLLIAPRVHPVLFYGGDALAQSGLTGAALDYFQELLGDAVALLGPDNVDVFDIRHRVAVLAGHARKPANASEALERLLADVEHSVGQDSQQALTIRTDLAAWRSNAEGLAEFPEAEQAYRDALRVLGPGHRVTLSARHNLAMLIGRRGDLSRAIAELNQVLRQQQELLGPHHPNSLATRLNLALFNLEAGGIATARAEFEALLTDQLRVLGADHPHVLATRANIARGLAATGNWAGAVAAFEHLLSDQLRVLGPDHPETLVTRHNLALFRGGAGDPAGAVAAFEHLLSDQLRVLGPDHPETLVTRHNLALFRGGAGDPAGAVAAFEHLLSDQLRILGSDHPDTEATRKALQLLQRSTSKAIFVVDASQAKGVIIGDHATQHNTFHTG